jgi:hypothetical protein
MMWTMTLGDPPQAARWAFLSRRATYSAFLLPMAYFFDQRRNDIF